MKLVIVIVRDLDSENVTQALVDKNFRVTRVASTGGFLRRGNVTLLIGVADDKVDAVFTLLQETCSASDGKQHRATIFVVDMSHFEQI